MDARYRLEPCEPRVDCSSECSCRLQLDTRRLHAVRLYWPAVALLALISACGDRSGVSASAKVSVCSISSTPSKFDGRTVTVHALLASSGRDGVRLVDPACPDTALLLVPRGGFVDKSVTDLTTK